MDLLAQAKDLRVRILSHLQLWPRRTEDSNMGINFRDQDVDLRDRSTSLIIETQAFFNKISSIIGPNVLTPKEDIYYLMRSVCASIKKQYYKIPYPVNSSVVRTIDPSSIAGRFMSGDQRMNIDVDCSIDNAIDELNQAFDSVEILVQALPDDKPSLSRSDLPSMSFVPNTAFIIMWMNKDKPELEDVHNTIKEVCESYGIRAERADDVEHSDRITDLILNKIKSAEFLVADLSGERPNVYYEVGFAHALGKRPILFRKAGTALHFDLSVHNVPEYKNISELKTMLIKRFGAIFGKEVERD